MKKGIGLLEDLLYFVGVQWTDPAFVWAGGLWLSLAWQISHRNASAYLRKRDCWYGSSYQKHTKLVTGRNLWALLALRLYKLVFPAVSTFTPSFLLAMSVVTATQNGLSLPVAEGS